MIAAAAAAQAAIIAVVVAAVITTTIIIIIVVWEAEQSQWHSYQAAANDDIIFHCVSPLFITHCLSHICQ